MRDYAMVKTLLERDLASFSRPLTPFEDLNPREAAAAHLQRGLFKKLAPLGQSEDAINATIVKFVDLNSRIHFDPPNSRDDESMTYMLHLARDELWRLLDDDANGDGCSFDFLSENLTAGPGASRNADSTNWYSKMWDSNHSHTSPFILALFRAAVCKSETWTDALMHWEKSFRPIELTGNSLFTVPKNSEISRTCCTEPLLNMLFQQAVGKFIEQRLNNWGISLAKQPDLNRRLCLKGSINGAYGTIDLSSASDSIAASLCQWILPKTVRKWVNLFRSNTTCLPNKSEVQLNMVSTMGNGFTFPLETAIFASAVRAVYLSKGIKPSMGSETDDWAVFGDDIIVRKDCYETTIRLLKRLGFSVNEGKSFNNGPFRESCGFDYFQGVNIRPVYIETLETPQAVYSAFNRLSRWSAENRIPLVRTLRYIMRMARFLPVPFSEADDCGFKVPCPLAPLRFNSEGWYRYSCIVPESTAMKVPRDTPTARKAGYKSFNPYGWELAFLGGYAHNRLKPLVNPTPKPDKPGLDDVDLINRRPFQGEVLRRRRRTKFTPFWDWFGSEDEGRFSRSSLAPWQGGLVALLSSDS
jgi:hypothetical protein